MNLHLLWRKIRHRPIIILTACFAVGIFCADFLGSTCITIALITLLAGVGFAFVKQPRWLGLAGIVMAMVGLGAVLHALQITPMKNDVSHFAPQQALILRAWVIKQGSSGENWSTCTCEVNELISASGQLVKAAGRVQVYLDTQNSPRSGAQVEFYNPQLRLPTEPTNWGQINQKQRLARQGIFCLASTQNWSEISQPQGIIASISQAQIKAAAILHRGLSLVGGERQAVLVTGMVFGSDAVSVDEATEELFRKTGTIHLLVVSGAQVSTVVLLLLMLTRSGQHPGWWHFLYLGPLLLWFGLITGMGASVLRSLVMAGVGLVCLVSGRKYDIVASMGLAGLWVLFSNTSNLFSVGAQLTFLATAGVYALLPATKINALGDRVYPPMPVVVAQCTLGAWLMTTPVLIHVFHEAALVGSVANLIVVPLSAVMVVAGLTAALLGMISPVIVIPLCWVCKWLAVLTLAAVDWGSHLPGAYLTNLYLPGWGVIIWLVGISVVIYLVKYSILASLWRQNKGVFVTAGISLLAVFLVLLSLQTLLPKPAGMTFFDVGEGQCVVIETGTGQAILVDGGGRSGMSAREIARSVLLPWLLQRNYHELAAVISTHPDYDHFGAAAELTKNFPVQLVITNGDSGAENWRQWLDELKAQSVDIRTAGAGDSIKFAGINVEFLWPKPGNYYQSRNNKSLVMLMDIKKIRTLFLGDLESEALEALATSEDNRLQCMVVQVPHHGRDSATSESIVKATAASLAVVSRGPDENGRGGEQAFEQAGSQVCATGETGAIQINMHHGRVVWKTYRRQMQQ